MKRSWSFGMVLALVLGLLFAISPTASVEAAVSWPLKVDRDAYGLTVASNGQDLLFGNCSGGYTAGRITNNQVSYDYPPVGSDLSCDPTMQTEIVDQTGTAYQLHWDASAGVNQLKAVKNGRIKWSKDLQWSDGCPGNRRPWNIYSPESLSIGADGNVYFVAMPIAGNCPAYVVGLNAYTGQELSITQNIGPWVWVGQIRPKVWTYDSYIIFIDAWNMKHVYNYNGMEDTSKQYQYSFNPNTSATALANEDGRVFVVASCGDNTIYYSDLNGDHGSTSRIDCGFRAIAENYIAGPNGTLVSSQPVSGAIYIRDLTTTPATVEMLNTTDYGALGYTLLSLDGITNLQVDQAGNVIASMTYTVSSNQTKRDVYIEYVDAATNTPSSLLSLIGDGTDANRPNTAGQTPIVVDGYLYSSIAHGYTGGATYDTYIHKTDVATAGFGTPIPQGPGFAEPTNKLEYVAMGDSFSSGEGVETFIWGTNVDNVNECHRSENAYPVLLAQDDNLNLNLTDFVACSGATTQNVLQLGSGTGSWGEYAQVQALSERTDVVTVTVGGNDIGFKEYAEYCSFHGECGLDNPYYEDAMEKLNNDLPTDLTSMFQQILSRAPQAHVYVIGYPYLVDPYAECISFGWADDLGILDLTDDLNDTIDQAVSLVEADSSHPTNANRIEYVDPNIAGGPFEDHYLCSVVPYFHTALVANSEYSYHPNNDGQAAYATLLEGKIS